MNPILTLIQANPDWVTQTDNSVTLDIRRSLSCHIDPNKKEPTVSDFDLAIKPAKKISYRSGDVDGEEILAIDAHSYIDLSTGDEKTLIGYLNPNMQKVLITNPNPGTLSLSFPEQRLSITLTKK